MKILITGGAGFIGSHTADELIEMGHTVRILDNLQTTVHPKGKPEYLHPDAEFVRGDVRDKPTMEKALKGVEAVYHFAAYQDYLTDFSTFFQVNAASTALLYEILIEKGTRSTVRKVIVAASQAVMGEGRYKCPICYKKNEAYLYPEIRLESRLSKAEWDHQCPDCGNTLQWMPSDETVVHPCNPYALSKHSQEQIALQLGKRYGIPTVVLRYSIVQGPRQSFYNAYSGAMRIFALSLMLERSPVIFEDGAQIRDYTNIHDVVAANLTVLEDARADHRVFNVGGGVAWTVIDFYNKMQQIVDIEKAPTIEGYYRYGDTRHIFSDIGCIESLGWKPVHTVETSIRDYWEYVRYQKDTRDVLDYAEAHMKQTGVIRKAR